MPMTQVQRKNALEDLTKDLARRFPSVGGANLLVVEGVAAKLAIQHHDNDWHECLVVHPGFPVLVKDDDGNLLASAPQGSEDALVYALKCLRVPTRLKTTKLVECGCCGCYHPVTFYGDCRDDGNRFPHPNDPDDEGYEEGVDIDDA